MKRINQRISGIVGFSLICLLTIMFASSQAYAKTYRWRLQSVWSTKTTTKYLNDFAANVKKATDGQVLIKVYSANQLVKIKSTLGAVQKGAVEMGCGSGFYNATIIPEANIEGGLPYAWRNFAELWQVWSMYGIQDIVREAYEEKGLFHLTLQSAGDYTIMTTKPVRKLEDFEGMKIRTWGSPAKVLKKFGASPTMIPGAEQYIALQRGTIDGTVYPAFVLDVYKLREVIKYVIVPSIIDPPTTNIYVNLKAWKSLPVDLQEKIDRVAQLHTIAYSRELLTLREKAIANLVEKGGEVLTLPDSELKRLRQASFVEWEELAKKTPRSRKIIDLMNQFMEDKGLK